MVYTVRDDHGRDHVILTFDEAIERVVHHCGWTKRDARKRLKLAMKIGDVLRSGDPPKVALKNIDEWSDALDKTLRAATAEPEAGRAKQDDQGTEAGTQRLPRRRAAAD